MNVLDQCNHRHSVLVLHNCRKSTILNLYQVLLHLGLLCTPEILFAPSPWSSNGATFQSETYMWYFYPSSIHSSYKYAHHALLTYKSCRTIVAVFVETSIANDSYLWHVFLLPSRQRTIMQAPCQVSIDILALKEPFHLLQYSSQRLGSGGGEME